MMKLFSIKDSKSSAFQGVYVFVNAGVAVRSLQAAAKAGQLGLLSEYPADFDLYCLGTFDEDTGALTSEISLVAHFAEVLEDAKKSV